MKYISLFLMFPILAAAQDPASPVAFTSVPKNFQLYPRDVKTNQAQVVIEGKVTEPKYNSIQLTVYKGGEKLNSSSKRLKYLADGAPFSFSGTIDAGLFNHDFEISLLRAGEDPVEVTRVKNVVAGDVFVINGQSNAEARSFRGSANGNQGEFLRSFSARIHNPKVAEDITWRKADGDLNNGPAAVGQWGLRMGRLIVDAEKIPVAVINGALGGRPIGHYKRNEAKRDDLNTNYGRLLHRCRAAGVVEDVRAILWYQGESDKGAADVHENGFVQLYQNWLEDYPGLEKVYVNQLRCGCGVDKWNVDLRDRQRRLPEKHPGIAVMSTTGIDQHDGCHYSYEKGYEIIGNRVAALLLRDLYGKDAKNVEAPNIAKAWFSKPDQTEITLKVAQQDILVWDDGAKADFRLEGSEAKIVSGRAKGNMLVLSLSGAAADTKGITYSGHAKAGAWVTNQGGIGLLTFWNVPVGNGPLIAAPGCDGLVFISA